jgi:hypothetical protein
MKRRCWTFYSHLLHSKTSLQHYSEQRPRLACYNN